MSHEVEVALKRIQTHNGVEGIIIINSDGIPIKSTLDTSKTIQYAGLMSELSIKAKSIIKELDMSNNLTFLRMRSKKNEIIVAPDKEYTVTVIQKAAE